MKNYQMFSFIIFLVLNYNFSIYTQDFNQSNRKIFVYDPNGVSESFQSSFSQLSSYSIFVADTIDENINNFEALFLFTEYPYTLSETEGNSLIEYLNLNKPMYISTNLYWQEIDSVAFWNYIGVNMYIETLGEIPVDSIVGVESTFTESVVIDIAFTSPGGPHIEGTVFPIIQGYWFGYPALNTTFIPEDETKNVIIDLYRLIHHKEFLSKVIEHFGLNKTPLIQFYPDTDTAWIAGGCVGPDIITHNLVSTSIRDSITVEPGPNSYFFYYDSFGNQIPVDKYYFTVIDSLDQNEYELWFHPKSFPPFEPAQILFDSTTYIYQNEFDIQLLVKRDNIPVDSLSQFFRAEWGLDVEDDETIPYEFELKQNYPNPFNPATSIQYTVSSWQFVSLKVYDILGNEIATLVNEEKPAGNYEVEFSINNLELTSGVYFYQLRAGSFIQTRKMLLIK